MMRKYLFLLLVFFSPLLAQAEPVLGIVATVNDEAITSADLDARTRLVLLGSGMPPSEEMRAQLRSQILRGLIDERLQLQEAGKLGVSVDESEIDAEVIKLADRNGQKVEQLPAFFARAGVSMSALREQIRAGIAWGKVVQRRLRPDVNITDRDIDAEVARLGSSAGQPEYLAAEIFLPVQSPDQDASVRDAAGRMVAAMAHGVRFSSVARQFSQSPSAAQGGDLGWIRSGQIDPALEEALRKLSPGTLTPPVRTSAGYHILMLREQRVIQAPSGTSAGVALDPAQIKLTLRQLLLPVAANASAADLAEATRKLTALRGQARSCADVERMAAELGDTRKGDLGTLRFVDIPAPLQPLLAAQAENQPTNLLRNDRGVLFLMICHRDQPAAPAAPGVDREAIANQLGMQKLELLARRYLQNLRQDAFIDIRS